MGSKWGSCIFGQVPKEIGLDAKVSDVGTNPVTDTLTSQLMDTGPETVDSYATHSSEIPLMVEEFFGELLLCLIVSLLFPTLSNVLLTD